MEKWLLEQRFCLCGCGLSFRCLLTSKSFYASLYHEPLFAQEFFSHGEMAVTKFKNRTVRNQELIRMKSISHPISPDDQ